MKKILVLLLTLLCLLTPAPNTAHAAPADARAFTLTDPVTGVSIQARNYGDEWFHFTADSEGRVLATDKMGAYYYVKKETDGSFRLGPPIADPAPQDPALVRMDDANLRQGLTALRQTIVPRWEERLRNPYARSTTKLYLLDDDYDFSASTSRANPLYNSIFPYDTGSVKVPPKESTCALAVILVDFDNVTLKFTDEEWRKRIFDDGVANYYHTVSNGRFTYEPVHETYGVANDGVIHVSLPIDALFYVAPNDGNQNISADVLAGEYEVNGRDSYTIFNTSFLFAYAINAAESLIDLRGYDRNNDDFISPTEVAFMVVCAGYEAAFCHPPEGKTAVWAHSWTVNTYRKEKPQNPVDPDRKIIGETMCVGLSNYGITKYVYKYTILGENTNELYDYETGSGTPDQAQYGTPCHELGHDLGLADLYNTNYQQATRLNVDSLSVMASGVDGAAGSGEVGSSPTHFDPESKIRLGFYEPTVANKSGVYTLYATEPSNLYNILRINTNDPDVYYLVENRQFAGYDRGLESSFTRMQEGGAVIWRVDDKRIRGHYANNTLNTTEGDYGIMPVFLDETKNNPYNVQIPFWGGAFRALGRTSFAIPERPGAILYLQDAGGLRTTVRLALPSEAAEPAKDAPQTGDSAAPLQWSLIALCAAAAFLALAMRRRRA